MQFLRTANVLLSIALGTLFLVVAGGCRRNANATVQPAAVAAVNRGVIQMGQYDYEAAAKSFTEALAVAPDNADIKVNLAIARFNRGKKELQDIEEADHLLDAVIAQDPQNVRAWYNKGIVLQHQGQADRAIDCFKKVLQSRPDDGIAWYILALCKQRLGQDCEKELIRAIELRPHLASAYYRLWQTLQGAGKTQRAAPYLEHFKQLRDSALAETIELPQYNQMGDLALATPLTGTSPAPKATSVYQAGSRQDLALTNSSAARSASAISPDFGGAAFSDSAHSGHPQWILTGSPVSTGQLPFFLQSSAATDLPTGTLNGSGLENAASPIAVSVGDFDNDDVPDLLLLSAAGPSLFRGSANGTYAVVPNAFSAPAAGAHPRSALWFDADHDGDLDLLILNSGGPNQLFRNNADGTFTDITADTELAVPEGNSVMALPGDIDEDRDVDLVLLRENAPAKIFLNDLSGKFHEAKIEGADIRGDLGGVLQDFDGDGHLDLLVLGGNPAAPQLYLGDGHGHFQPSAAFVETAKSLTALGPLNGVRVADVNLDGSLDIAVFGAEGHLLLNDGQGHFTLQAHVWQPSAGNQIAGVELVDLTGDLVPDLLLIESGKAPRVALIPGKLSPSSTAIGVTPSGIRSRDKRTRSPASGYGVTASARTGLREHTRLCTGQFGGSNQSPLPLIFGLGGAARADYVRLLWSDGVAQIENALAAGQVHAISEMQRKISSCPVLFTWNGSRFEFITDFAGVGGLGYFVAPGEYAPPQPVDYVKIEASQLQARNGRYDLRITEPMEETAYVDSLQLVAIDQPVDWQVFPDERLVISGPAPTHELYAVRTPVFAQSALDSNGVECADRLRRVDRLYAYDPILDRRFIGFSQPHTLQLDFGTQLASLQSGQRVILFINGYLEYPYSQTAYAAAQAGIGWQPIRVDQQLPDGTWATLVADAGALGGMARTMTVDLTGLLKPGPCRLRLSSNLEIYYDQIFLGNPESNERLTVRTVPLADAELRYLGFAREVSPDGHEPLIYDYQQVDPSAPFHVLTGAYTRYGLVRELLTDFDDDYVLVGPGDEIAASFDATQLPPPSPGMTRSFILISSAYCKDMDLYTADPQTLEPMPFRGMSRYPYPDTEHFPDTPRHRALREQYNTRIVK